MSEYGPAETGTDREEVSQIPYTGTGTDREKASQIPYTGTGTDREEVTQIPYTINRTDEPARTYTPQPQVSDRAVYRQAYKAQPGKIGTVFFCVWVMIAVILVQSAAGAAGILPSLFRLVMENGGDYEAIINAYNELLTSTSLLARVEIISVVAGTIFVLIWYYRGYVRKARLEGRYEPVGPKLKNPAGLLFLLTSNIACFSLAIMLEIIAAGLFPYEAEALNETMYLTLGKNEILGLLAAVLLAPICEELAMRGIILQRSRRVFGLAGCVIISGVLFSIFHMNPIQGLYVLPMGLLWGFIGYKYNSVIPSILCHMFNNFLGMFLGGILDPEKYLFIYAVLFMVFAAAALFLGRRVPFFHNEENLQEQPYTETW